MSSKDGCDAPSQAQDASTSSLDDLLRQVEAATGPDREIDRLIAIWQYPELALWPATDDGGWASPMWGKIRPADAYTASVDAALALVERAGDGYRLYSVDASIPGRFSVVLKGPDRLWPADEDSEACVAPGWERGASASLPLALCAALLRALQQKAQDHA